jgi:phosphotransferase system  glucose/maltose/N-acetylglucosamine-specific IIC component
MDSHIRRIQLIIAYTFTIVIVLTALITLLSLTPLLTLSSPEQQERLFNVLIIELCVAAVPFFVATFLKGKNRHPADKVTRSAIKLGRPSDTLAKAKHALSIDRNQFGVLIIERRNDE